MDAVDFKWLRCFGAFRIVQTGTEADSSRRGWRSGAAGQPYLDTKGKKSFELYAPTKFPALFQRFADTPHTAEGMRDFFNVYGPLELVGAAHRNPIGDDPVRNPSAGLHEFSLGLREPLAQHGALQQALKLYETGDLSALVEMFNRGWGQLRAELRLRPESKVEMVLTPANLIQFLWLQFSLFVASGAKLLRCERCSEPIIVGSGTGRRGTAKFCSNACKTASFREGKRSHA